MSNPKDFQAKQIRLQRLITSGGFGSDSGLTVAEQERVHNLGLMIYSSSVATDFAGGVNSDVTRNSNDGLSGMLEYVGTDVVIFVSGSRTTDGDPPRARSDVMLYGGDLVVSGTLWAERMVIEVEDRTGGDLLISGSLHIKPDSAPLRSHHQLWVEDGTDPFPMEGSSTVFVVDTMDKRVGVGVEYPKYTLHILSSSEDLTDIRSSRGRP